MGQRYSHRQDSVVMKIGFEKETSKHHLHYAKLCFETL